jgi:major membrane immunogen (membrane-anchored lipoprotein)
LKRTLFIIFLAAIIASFGFTEAQQEGRYQDGIYFAMEDGYSHGWKYVVTFEVKYGDIISADWNGVSDQGGPTKDEVSTAGKYPLVDVGGAQAPWHIQAERAEEWLVLNQDPSMMTYNDDQGHTDAISGASIHVIEMFDLAQKALAMGPVGRGMYRDGYYSATGAEFDHGFKYFVEITVVNGYIAAVDWDAHSEEDSRTKDEISEAGEYPLVAAGGAQAEWHVQAQKVEDYLIKTQDPAKVQYSDESGHTDAISGATIGVSDFFELAAKALKWAK